MGQTSQKIGDTDVFYEWTLVSCHGPCPFVLSSGKLTATENSAPKVLYKKLSSRQNFMLFSITYTGFGF